jgi:hypothetical protein
LGGSVEEDIQRSFVWGWGGGGAERGERRGWWTLSFCIALGN